MVFNSLTFVAFFALVLAMHSLPLGWTTKKINLLIASYIFYSAWNPPFVILLWISTVVDWYAAQGLVKSERPVGAARVDDAVGGRQPRHARLLQVRAVPARQFQRADGVDGRRLPSAARGHRAAGRHLVLYICDVVVHARHLPAPRAAGAQLPRLRAVRHVLPASGRRADHASDRTGAAVRAAAQGDVVAIALRTGADDAGLVQQGRHRRHVPGQRRRKHLRRRQDSRRARRVGGDARVQRPDFLRLRRLFDDRDRRGDVSGFRDAGQFPLSVCGGRILRFLAAMAHHAVVVAARLSVHSARRKSSRRRRAPTRR